MLIFSKHNIYSSIKDSDKAFIVNILNGSADILEPHEAGFVEMLKTGHEVPQYFSDMMEEKGYLIDEQEEKRLLRNKYFEFLDNRDDDEIQLFFVPNFSCNFACSYCYQDEYHTTPDLLTREVVDAFFRYVATEFAGRKTYITLFGGEPLLPSARQKEAVTYFLSAAKQANLEISIVTNGYSLAEYIDILKIADIREIQVTLDGTSEVHNSRRFLKGGGPTFDGIVQGIDLCLENDLPVNLRMVVDKENLHDLPGLARFAMDKGWTDTSLFKTQLGRNYELHHCQVASSRLFSRIELYEQVYSLVKQHPHIMAFHKPAFSVSRFLSENGSLPEPLFDSCPAAKTEWAFDYTGTIYPCTATVGKENEALGSFYPEVSRNHDLIGEWERRDVTEIPACVSCNLQLACGGGCGSVAKNQSGSICMPDCRPVTPLLELGFATYFSQKI